MTFTWTGDPAASTIEQIRAEIFDTDSTNALFTDEWIEYVLTLEHTVLNTAARLCEQLSTKYAGDVDRAMGPLRVDLSKKATYYYARAKELRKRAMAFAEPYVGGISKAKDAIFENDSDLNQPIFKKGLMDNE
jgi:hypothetical protein